ncbi:MAG: hypothetical protein WA159_21090 [Variovorax sp.]
MKLHAALGGGAALTLSLLTCAYAQTADDAYFRKSYPSASLGQPMRQGESFLIGQGDVQYGVVHHLVPGGVDAVLSELLLDASEKHWVVLTQARIGANASALLTSGGRLMELRVTPMADSTWVSTSILPAAGTWRQPTRRQAGRAKP